MELLLKMIGVTLLAGVGAFALAGPPSLWTLASTPSTTHFNGISASSRSFAIAVGNGGNIVHFNNGDNGTLMTSGTTQNLLDVFVSSPSLAIAGGEGIVLLWNGSAWSEIRSSSAGAINSGIWITPEEDVVLFNDLYPGQQFPYFVCPYHIGDTMPRFCRSMPSAMLTACGRSDDIKLILTNGDIYNVNNSVVDIVGFDPIYDHPVDLGLTAVWVPPVTCLAGPIPPQVAFAIRNNNEIWRFDGIAWTDMGAPIPSAHTLTWLDGNGTDNIVAVGFTSAGATNDGVVWIHDADQGSLFNFASADQVSGSDPNSSNSGHGILTPVQPSP